MIKKLTQEQEARIPYYLQKYRDIVKGETNHDEQDRSIKDLYKLAGEDEPVILHFTSPTLAIMADKVLQNTDKEKLDLQLHSQLESQLRSQLYSQLDLQLHSQLRSQLYSQLYSQLHSRLYSQLHSQLHPQLRSQLYSQLDSQLYLQLYSQLNSQLYSQLHPQLRSQLCSQLDSQLYLQLHSGNNYFWLMFWWNSWVAYYQFGKEIGVNLDEEKLDIMTRLAEHLHYIIPYKGICLVSDKPTEVLWHNSGVLHCEEGMAVQYSDGTGLYSLHGISFDEELYWKVVKRKLTFEEIQRIKDIDKKAIAMKYMPAMDFLKSVKAELVCEKTKRGNELWKIPKGNVELFDQDEYYLHYYCSSSGREYLEAVEPNLAVESNFNADWLMAKRHKFTIEQYLDEHFVGV